MASPQDEYWKKWRQQQGDELDQSPSSSGVRDLHHHRLHAMSVGEPVDLIALANSPDVASPPIRLIEEQRHDSGNADNVNGREGRLALLDDNEVAPPPSGIPPLSASSLRLRSDSRMVGSSINASPSTSEVLTARERLARRAASASQRDKKNSRQKSMANSVSARKAKEAGSSAAKLYPSARGPASKRVSSGARMHASLQHQRLGPRLASAGVGERKKFKDTSTLLHPNMTVQNGRATSRDSEANGREPHADDLSPITKVAEQVSPQGAKDGANFSHETVQSVQTDESPRDATKLPVPTPVSALPPGESAEPAIMRVDLAPSISDRQLFSGAEQSGNVNREMPDENMLSKMPTSKQEFAPESRNSYSGIAKMQKQYHESKGHDRHRQKETPKKTRPAWRSVKELPVRKPKGNEGVLPVDSEAVGQLLVASAVGGERRAQRVLESFAHVEGEWAEATDAMEAEEAGFGATDTKTNAEIADDILSDDSIDAQHVLMPRNVDSLQAVGSDKSTGNYHQNSSSAGAVSHHLGHENLALKDTLQNIYVSEEAKRQALKSLNATMDGLPNPNLAHPTSGKPLLPLGISSNHFVQGAYTDHINSLVPKHVQFCYSPTAPTKVLAEAWDDAHQSMRRKWVMTDQQKRNEIQEATKPVSASSGQQENMHEEIYQNDMFSEATNSKHVRISPIKRIAFSTPTTASQSRNPGEGNAELVEKQSGRFSTPNAGTDEQSSAFQVSSEARMIAAKSKGTHQWRSWAALVAATRNDVTTTDLMNEVKKHALSLDQALQATAEVAEHWKQAHLQRVNIVARVAFERQNSLMRKRFFHRWLSALRMQFASIRVLKTRTLRLSYIHKVFKAWYTESVAGQTVGCNALNSVLQFIRQDQETIRRLRATGGRTLLSAPSPRLKVGTARLCIAAKSAKSSFAAQSISSLDFNARMRRHASAVKQVSTIPSFVLRNVFHSVNQEKSRAADARRRGSIPACCMLLEAANAVMAAFAAMREWKRRTCLSKVRASHCSMRMCLNAWHTQRKSHLHLEEGLDHVTASQGMRTASVLCFVARKVFGPKLEIFNKVHLSSSNPVARLSLLSFALKSFRSWRSASDELKRLSRAAGLVKMFNTRRSVKVAISSLRQAMHSKQRIRFVMNSWLNRGTSRLQLDTFTAWKLQQHGAVERRERVTQICRRWMNMSIARAFLQWSTSVHDAQESKASIRSVIMKWRSGAIAPAFNSWKLETQRSKFVKISVGRFFIKSDRTRIFSSFCHWRDAIEVSKQQKLVLHKVVFRMQNLSVSNSFATWAEKVMQWKKDRIVIGKVVARWLRSQLSKCFSSWHAAVKSQVSAKLLLRNVAARWTKAAAASAFDAWFENIKEMQRRRKIVKKVLLRWTHQQQSAVICAWSNAIRIKNRNQKILLKFVSMWQNMALTKAFHSWKQNMLQSRHAKAIIQRIIFFSRAKAFNKWSSSARMLKRQRHILGKVIWRMQHGLLTSSFVAWQNGHLQRRKQAVVLVKVLNRWNNATYARAFDAWLTKAVSMKKARVTVAKVLHRWTSQQLLRGFNALRFAAQHHAHQKQLMRSVCFRLQNKSLALALQSWAQRVSDVNRQRNILSRTLSRWSMQTVSRAFSTWHSNVVTLNHGRLVIARVVSRWRNSVLLAALNNWKQNIESRRLVESKAAAVILKWRNINLASAFEGWKQCAQKQALAKAKVAAVLTRWSLIGCSKAFNSLLQATSLSRSLRLREVNAQKKLAVSQSRRSLDVLRRHCVQSKRVKRIVGGTLRKWRSSALSHCWNTWKTAHQNKRRVRATSLRVLVKWMKSQLVSSFELWKERTHAVRQSKGILRKVVARMRNASMWAAWDAWMVHADRQRHFRSVATRCLLRWQNLTKANAFAAWRSLHFKILHERAVIETFVNKWQHRAVLPSFSKWKGLLEQKHRASRLMNSVLGRWQHGDLNAAFHKWVNYVEQVQNHRNFLIEHGRQERQFMKLVMLSWQLQAFRRQKHGMTGAMIYKMSTKHLCSKALTAWKCMIKPIKARRSLQRQREHSDLRLSLVFLCPSYSRSQKGWHPKSTPFSGLFSHTSEVLHHVARQSSATIHRRVRQKQARKLQTTLSSSFRRWCLETARSRQLRHLYNAMRNHRLQLVSASYIRHLQKWTSEAWRRQDLKQGLGAMQQARKRSILRKFFSLFSLKYILRDALNAMEKRTERNLLRRSLLLWSLHAQRQASLRTRVPTAVSTWRRLGILSADADPRHHVSLAQESLVNATDTEQTRIDELGEWKAPRTERAQARAYESFLESEIAAAEASLSTKIQSGRAKAMETSVSRRRPTVSFQDDQTNFMKTSENLNALTSAVREAQQSFQSDSDVLADDASSVFSQASYGLKDEQGNVTRDISSLHRSANHTYTQGTEPLNMDLRRKQGRMMTSMRDLISS